MSRKMAHVLGLVGVYALVPALLHAAPVAQLAPAAPEVPPPAAPAPAATPAVPPPAVAPAVAPAGAPAAAQPGAPAATGLAARPFARFNRVAVSMAFGFGSAGLRGVHDLADRQVTPQLSGAQAPQSSLQINAEIALRYYAPYYGMIQVGYGTLYNKVSEPVSVNGYNFDLINHNLVMEVPILLGGYYPLIQRLYVFAALGPTIFFYPRSFWDLTPGGSAPDYKTEGGVGFAFLTGADFLVTDVLGVGLEFRYRNLKGKNLVDTVGGTPPPGGPYDLDFSGVSVSLVARFYVY